MIVGDHLVGEALVQTARHPVRRDPRSVRGAQTPCRPPVRRGNALSASAARRQRLAHFPSDTRDLARLWWIGEGTMSIRSDRFGLAFRLHRDGADLPVQLVPAPVAPMTLDEYLTLSRRDDRRPPRRRRRTAVTRALFAGEDYDLPPGAVFAAHGDDCADRKARGRSVARRRRAIRGAQRHRQRRHLRAAPRAEGVAVDPARSARPGAAPEPRARGRDRQHRDRQRLCLCARPPDRA